MIVVIFRSRLTTAGMQDPDYLARDAELEHLVKENPGYVSHKGYQAPDGERLTLVWFKDKESLRAWKQHPTHAEAQRIGRDRWYSDYLLDIAEVVRSSSFERPGGPDQR